MFVELELRICLDELVQEFEYAREEELERSHSVVASREEAPDLALSYGGPEAFVTGRGLLG